MEFYTDIGLEHRCVFALPKLKSGNTIQNSACRKSKKEGNGENENLRQL